MIFPVHRTLLLLNQENPGVKRMQAFDIKEGKKGTGKVFKILKDLLWQGSPCARQDALDFPSLALAGYWGRELRCIETLVQSRFDYELENALWCLE